MTKEERQRESRRCWLEDGGNGPSQVWMEKLEVRDLLLARSSETGLQLCWHLGFSPETCTELLTSRALTASVWCFTNKSLPLSFGHEYSIQDWFFSLANDWNTFLSKSAWGIIRSLDPSALTFFLHLGFYCFPVCQLPSLSPQNLKQSSTL